MDKCGGKDVYFNNGTVVKDAFEGFLGPGLERLIHGIRCCYIPIYYTMHFLTNFTVQGLDCMCGRLE